MSTTADSSPAEDSPSDGLPKASPDRVEQDQPEDVDNIVPSRGYQRLPVVALGGSAGSIPALREFFQEMPPQSGMAFVVILHLAPQFESTLPELLSRCTRMNVVQASDGQRLEEDTVYVIPPGKHIQAVDGKLSLTDLQADKGKRVAVDLFFRSLADTHGPRALAVVLSGADGDGAIGIKRIKERGGLTVVQDPDEAEHSGMPQSAINTGMVDWMLTVRDMPARLLQYMNRADRLKVPPEDGPQLTKVTRPTDDATEAALLDVLTFLRARLGCDFSYYKRATIVRRVARRLQVNGLEDLPKYLDFLRTHPGEAGALLQDLLISVTNFFRDRDAFQALESYLPRIFQDKTEADTVRVWVPACASGEEAYSIGMILFDYVRNLKHPPTVQVFGCDLDADAIQIARSGVYPEAIVADVSEQRLQRYFIKEARGYRVRRELREAVLFATHDLLKDPPFSKMDLVSCRNLLIYLNREAQARALGIFHFALRPAGLLFLGSAESVDEANGLFRVLNGKYRIHEQKPTARMTLPLLVEPSPLLTALNARQASVLLPRNFDHTPAAAPVAPPITSAGERQSLAELHFRLLEHMGPPSVIVNTENEIVHLSESMGKFLLFSGGEPTTNLLRVVHPALRAELRAALFRALKTGETVEVPNVPFQAGEVEREVSIRVTPARELAPGIRLVVFDEQERSVPRERLEAKLEPLVPHLERELEHVKRQLRDVVEQYETSGEELKASNEELQAMNEELRSTTEELETSREELQSINEELTTVNQELKGTVDELAHANSDLNNFMASTEIATIFIDKELRVLRYTQPAVNLFHFIPGDVGRPLQDLRDRLTYPELSTDALRVLEKLTPVDREVGDSEGRWYLARLLPYRTAEDRISGVVITFIEISQRKKAEEALRQSEARYRTLFDSIDEGFCVVEPVFNEKGDVIDHRFVEVNPSFQKLTGLREPVGMSVRLLFPKYRHDWFRVLGEVATTGHSVRFEKRAEEGDHWYDVYAFRCQSEKPLLAILFTDITEKKRAEEAVRESQEQLRLIVGNAREFAIFSMDLERNVTTWNTGAEHILGYTAAEMKGRSADRIFTNEDRRMGAPKQEAEKARTEGRAGDDRWHLRKGGKRFWASGYMMAMRGGSGDVIGFVKILHDRTEAKQTEEELARSRLQLEAALEETERARQDAEAAGRTKDHFLATLSHELRTPLTPVLMTAETLLKRKDLPDRAVEGLMTISRNIEIQTHLIDDLLDVTRIARGSFEIAMEPMDLHEAITGALQICQGDFNKKGQELKVELAASERQILGDQARVQQVFWNLLKNASKFTPDCGCLAVISTNEGDRIAVTVTDSGMGIDPTRLTDIFEAFRQGDISITRRFGGLGLGLAIAKATVEALGGTIRAASEGSGKGAQFTVVLPLKKETGVSTD